MEEMEAEPTFRPRSQRDAGQIDLHASRENQLQSRERAPPLSRERAPPMSRERAPPLSRERTVQSRERPTTATQQAPRAQSANVRSPPREVTPPRSESSEEPDRGGLSAIPERTEMSDEESRFSRRRHQDEDISSYSSQRPRRRRSRDSETSYASRRGELQRRGDALKDRGSDLEPRPRPDFDDRPYRRSAPQDVPKRPWRRSDQLPTAPPLEAAGQRQERWSIIAANLADDGQPPLNPFGLQEPLEPTPEVPAKGNEDVESLVTSFRGIRSANRRVKDL
eukprot:TRINITY_DN263_c0_g2_i1.p2 TRINITY_DN263_c0_g2~~TRINITY_DN263_c0_g2_i1.p2  ORF type:complete len:280 (+),score=52.63 TRINITY_DN263_c0_g2_i1:1125-1964(+)